MVYESRGTYLDLLICTPTMVTIGAPTLIPHNIVSQCVPTLMTLVAVNQTLSLCSDPYVGIIKRISSL